MSSGVTGCHQLLPPAELADALFDWLKARLTISVVFTNPSLATRAARVLYLDDGGGEHTTHYPLVGESARSLLVGGQAASVVVVPFR